MALNESPEISGILKKKRGGFYAKLMLPQAWQSRYFLVTKTGSLWYYETEIPDLESKPRGLLDLSAVEYELITDHHIEGAPTPYSIQICPINDERWLLCCDTKEDHYRWCQIFEKYVHHTSGSTGHHTYASDDEYDTARKGSISRDSSMRAKRQTMATSTASRDTGLQKAHSAPRATSMSTPYNKSGVVSTASNTSGNSISASANDSASANNSKPQDATRRPSVGTLTVKKRKGGLRIEKKSAAIVSPEFIESTMVLMMVNLSFYVVAYSYSWMEVLFFVLVANGVVYHTLVLRDERIIRASNNNSNKVTAEDPLEFRISMDKTNNTTTNKDSAAVLSAVVDSASLDVDDSAVIVEETSLEYAPSGKPKPGFSFQEVHTEPKQSPDHSWCRVDSKYFNVRIGPEYSRYKKKAPSPNALYEPFAVDAFCTKKRIDHAAQRFELPDTSHIDTHNEFVPPIFVIQIQIPSEPPTSIFSSSEDGPGWAILMYYKITEETCNQLKDLGTASPAVKLFAQYCEKAFTDPQWRARFKLIGACSNLDELGFPSAVAGYNAKPILIRRTGSLFRGPNYIEMNIHIHKFANLARQSIYLLSSRCGQMYMQIGFVIEGRDDSELPEALFACVAVNKPKEELADFIFDDEV